MNDRPMPPDRPGQGSNPDVPTERGYAQNPADATMRADASALGTERVDQLAWSQEGPQAGEQPTHDFQENPYQQQPYPQYHQDPQYQQPQYEQYPQYQQDPQYQQYQQPAPAPAPPAGRPAHLCAWRCGRGGCGGIAGRWTGLHLDQFEPAGGAGPAVRTANRGATNPDRRGPRRTACARADQSPGRRPAERAFRRRRVGR